MIYLTKDRYLGILSPGVSVWETKPIRVVTTELYDHKAECVIWHGEDGTLTYLEHLTDDECVKEYGTRPDSDLMLIKVGQS